MPMPESIAIPVLYIVAILTVLLTILLTYYIGIYPLISKGKIYIRKKPSRTIKNLISGFRLQENDFEKAYVNSRWQHLIFLLHGMILFDKNVSRYVYFLPVHCCKFLSFQGGRKAGQAGAQPRAQD